MGNILNIVGLVLSYIAALWVALEFVAFLSRVYVVAFPARKVEEGKKSKGLAVTIVMASRNRISKLFDDVKEVKGHVVGKAPSKN